MNCALRTDPPAARRGDWVQTYTGRCFWPLDPRSEEVVVEDIAHMLSLKCRYGGATRTLYSVAQHAVLLSHAVPPPFAFAALHHDDSEAYLPDVPAPVKPYLTGFKEIERGVEAAIGEAFGIPLAAFEAIKPWDRRICADEAMAFLNPPDEPWATRLEPLGLVMEAWSAERAEAAYLARHAALAAATP